MIEYDKFEKSLKHLKLQLANYRTLDGSLPELMKDAVAESVIQRFEVCYDYMWKVLKRYLAEELGLPETPNSPKPILRLAAENGLLNLPVEQWMSYADARTGTSHDYSGEKAQAALALMNDYVEDAIALYSKMSGEKWL